MKIIFCVLGLAMFNTFYGQTTLVDYDVNSNGEVAQSELIITDSLSFLRLKSDDPSPSSDNTFFVKRYQEKAVYQTEHFLNVVFYIKDSLHTMKWELTGDTARILNEKCFSARTKFRGRNYTAYYSTRYAYSNGPWKFGGLPGLILDVKSDDDYIHWSAVKITENSKEKAEPPTIVKNKFIGWDKYVEQFKMTVTKWGKLARSNGTLDGGTESKVKMEALEIIYPQFQTGEGISL